MASRRCTARHRARPLDDPYGPTDPWDVASWVFGPPKPHRLNTLFDRDDGAVVTACGRFVDASAGSELVAVLRPFEQLGCAVVVDVRRAVFGEAVVDLLVEAGLRHAPSSTGFRMIVIHADPATRRQFAGAGGALLLRPCLRCQQDRAAPAEPTSW